MLTNIENQKEGNGKTENDVMETINNVMNIITLMSTCGIPDECALENTVTLDTRRLTFEFLKNTLKENLNDLTKKGFEIPVELQDYLDNLPFSSKPPEEGAKDPFQTLKNMFMNIFV